MSVCKACGTPRSDLHPPCYRCGLRKGGPDSWDGKGCKCKLYERPMLACDPTVCEGWLTEGYLPEQVPR